MDKFPMTVGGHARLETELQQLKADRPVIIAMIAEARAHGDLSENAEYHAAREKQGMAEARITDLEDKISRAEVIDPAKQSGASVKFGATVTIVDEETDEETRYQIVGQEEADAKAGRLSVSSPLSRALISKTEGDRAEVDTPKGKRGYEILKVEWV